MKLGLLQCDQVADELRPRFGDYPDMFIPSLQRIDNGIEVRVYLAYQGVLPEDTNECDGYLTTGSKYSVYDPIVWIRPLQEFLLQLHEDRVPFVGICFGHQLLAQALGGSVEKATAGWGVGVHSVDIYKQAAWMDGATQKFSLIASHQDQVSRLPAGVDLLGGSVFCPNYLCQFNQFMIGVQGHPEFSNEYSRALMHLREDIIPLQRIQQGLVSLDRDTDSERFFEWMVNHLALAR